MRELCHKTYEAKFSYEAGPASDLSSGSTRKFSYKVNAVSPSRMLYMFRVLDTLPRGVTFHMFVFGSTWQDVFNIYRQKSYFLLQVIQVILLLEDRDLHIYEETPFYFPKQPSQYNPFSLNKHFSKQIEILLYILNY